MILTEENYIIFAAQAYMNQSCTSTDEFLEDLQRIKYLKKLFGQYKKTKQMNERLVMNHIVVLYNVFSARQCTKMLFFKLDEHWDCLKPFLLALGFLPERVDGIINKEFAIITDKIIMDYLVSEKVKGILRGAREKNENQ